MGEKVVAVIPARYESTRLPGKPLLEIAGVPLVMHVARQVRKAAGIDRIIVATDDQRVWSVVESGGVEAMMTSADHRSGTDRLAEVASQIANGTLRTFARVRAKRVFPLPVGPMRSTFDFSSSTP